MDTAIPAPDGSSDVVERLGTVTFSTAAETTPNRYRTVSREQHGYGDVAFIRTVSARARDNTALWMFTGDRYTTRATRIARLGYPGPGQQLCFSGATSGTNCGWTVRNAATGYQQLTDLVKVSKEGTCQQPGDSGAPVYYPTRDGVVIVGLLSGGSGGGSGGGSDHYGGWLDRCRMMYAPVLDAHLAFGGWLPRANRQRDSERSSGDRPGSNRAAIR